MPLTSCTVDGKSGFRWGTKGKCYTGPGAKKKALKQGIAEEGPKKFRDILQKDKASIGDRQTQLLAQAVYNEMYPRGAADEFLHSIASFFTTAEDGDNDSDKDVGDKGKKNDLDDTTDVRDGEFSGGSEDKRSNGPDGDSDNPPSRQQINNGEVVKSDDVDGDNESLATTELPEELSYGESTLDDHRDDVGLNSVVPKYDEEASPETKPGVPALQCDPPTRDETTPKANVYSGDEDEAEAEMDEENTSEADAEDGDGEDPERELAALAEYIEFAYGFISTEVRNHLPDEDFAGPHKSFPIRNAEDIRHASTLLHHSHDPSAVKRNIIRIAKKKGFKLPATWSHETEACSY
jgi:hypothetical protein